jgi:hypothetical protein
VQICGTMQLPVRLGEARPVLKGVTSMGSTQSWWKAFGTLVELLLLENS